ncbi:MAG: type II toxin-antitoxin system VapC family toxin [Crenarchaeota archaeon]|nr:type II toxin-antitoxin system VapC family toxin [Thermoproteota archaeon]
MPKTVYDTRFFVEYFYTQDSAAVTKAKEVLRKAGEHYVSAIVLHELYQLTLTKEGRETAILRTTLLEKHLKVVKIDAEIAKSSAELRHKYHLSMADSIIAATALFLKATCLSDDPHFKAVNEIKTAWI